MKITEFKNRRDKMSYEEATRDPIFLLQKRVIHVVEIPDGIEVGDDGLEITKTGEPITALEIHTQYDEHTIVMWETDMVFFSREEAEDYGNSRAYHYPDGWRVFCVCAHGELADILKENPDGKK